MRLGTAAETADPFGYDGETDGRSPFSRATKSRSDEEAAASSVGSSPCAPPASADHRPGAPRLHAIRCSCQRALESVQPAQRPCGYRELRSKPVARAWVCGRCLDSALRAINVVGASVYEREHLSVCIYDVSRAREYQVAPNLARVHRLAARVPSVGFRGGDRLRGEVVFVQQPADPVASVEAIELQQVIPRRRFVWRRRVR